MVHRARRRGRRSEPASQRFVLIPVYLAEDETGNPGAPGERCEHDDGLGAWDREGRCKVFWLDGVTDDAILKLARTRWEERGKPSVSEMCLAADDPLGGEFGATIDNPVMVAIVADSLHEYYGVMGKFPPSEQSHYWIKAAWAKANAVVRRELCGTE